ncbi:MAG: DUF6493 family protein [Pseudomonadota bacterium]
MTDIDDEQEILYLVEQGAHSACLSFLKSLDETERRKLSHQAIRTYRKKDRTWFDQLLSTSPADRALLDRQLECARILALGTAAPSELKKLGWRVVPDGLRLASVMRDRRPAWIDQWVETLIDDNPRMYQQVRTLMEAGVCQKPKSDGYIMGMIDGLPPARATISPMQASGDTLAKRIRSVPDIRDEDIWRLFEVEGNGDLSLTAFEKYVGVRKSCSWTHTLIELSEDNTIGRDRLLDASLDALDRDFAQFRAGWFSRFHDALSPTHNEMEARRGRYLRLLGSSIPPTVSFALKRVQKLAKANRLPADELAASIQPALQARAKGTVKLSLKLIAQAAKRSPDLVPSLCRVVPVALIHEATDVQHQALNLIETLGGSAIPEIRSAVSEYADAIAPSLRDYASKIASVSLVRHEVEELDMAAEASVTTIEPINSFDELLREWLRLLEDPSDPLDVERLVDGVARHGAARSEDFDKRIGPLKKRAEKLINDQTPDEIRFQLARLALGLTTGQITTESERAINAERASYFPLHDKEQPERSFQIVFYVRTHYLLERINGGFRLPLLSAPTDSRGFVSAEAIIARHRGYKAEGAKHDIVDAALALLRLSPDDRSDALESLDPQDEFERALAFALGGESELGKTDGLWIAAWAARQPYTDHSEIKKCFGRGLPDAGTVARFNVGFSEHYNWGFPSVFVEPKVEADVPMSFLTTLFHLSDSRSLRFIGVCGGSINMIRWTSTVWPLHQEPFFANGIHCDVTDQPLANNPCCGFFEPMLRQHVDVGTAGAGLLLLGLASKDTAIRSVAMDAAIVTIAEDRLDIEGLRKAMETYLPSRVPPPRRWTKSFSEISSCSRKHKAVIRDVIAGSLRHDPKKPARDLGGLVELLYELSVALDSPLTDELAIEFLSCVTGSGKLARFGKKLLAMG